MDDARCGVALTYIRKRHARLNYSDMYLLNEFLRTRKTNLNEKHKKPKQIMKILSIEVMSNAAGMLLIEGTNKAIPLKIWENRSPFQKKIRP